MGLGTGAIWLMPLVLAGTSVDGPPADHALLPDSVDVARQADPPFRDIQFQVRGEVRQRVIVRITPLGRVAPPPVVSLPSDAAPRRRPGNAAAECIPIAGIAGVRIGDERNLLLYMHDRRVIGTQLERSCQVSSFYSGFYVERPADGLLCAGRERLHARSGADCLLGSFHEVVDKADE